MSPEQQQLEAVIGGLEFQRGLLGDAVVDAAIGPLRTKLAALVAAQTGEGTPEDRTLKQVTVLFLDVVGSTTISQHLDPEEVHAVMDGALARFATVIRSRGGKVLRYAGDNLLAVFGAETAREDDVERAVHAGLELLVEGRQHGEQVQQQYGQDGFDVRVGIHTGNVLLGGGVDAECSINGMTVNIAARMEQTAPEGALRISHDTYSHVRGVFEVESQAPMQVKGLDEPIVTYLVKHAKPRAFWVATRGIEGVQTRMIGRDAELELLQDSFKRLISERKLGVVTVVAEAGLGKSRLLYEFNAWTETQPESIHMFQGRAIPSTRSQPYGLLRDILAWRLQIVDGDSMITAKTKIEQGIFPLFNVEDGPDVAQAGAHLIGHLIGLDFGDSRHVKGILCDPKQIRTRGFHAAAQLFRRVGAQDGSPVVLQLEDLHWADDGSLDFLNYLAQVNADMPMLMLRLTRPILFERRAEWSSPECMHQRIDLSPLDVGASRILANELLKKLPEIPVALRELIAGGAGGNPFFMEELVKMLVDEGTLEPGGECWTLHPEKLLITYVPQTLTGVLQGRLDGLPQVERLALQEASAIGFVFWDKALAAINSESPVALKSLVRRGLIVPRLEPRLDGVREYAFTHQILHQVTYNTLLKRTRRQSHASVAAWLAGLTGARAGDFLGLAAEHYEVAGDTANACEFFTRAAEHATTRHAHDAVLSQVARGLALLESAASPDRTDLSERRDLPAKLPLRWRLLDVRERTLNLQGKRCEQRVDLDALQRLADASGDERRRAELARRCSHLAMRTSDYRAQESAARQAMEMAERTGNEELKLEAQQLLSTAMARLGDIPAGRTLAKNGLAKARSRGLLRIEGGFLNILSVLANWQDDLVVALQMNQQGLLIDRELGDRQSEARTLGNLGVVWLQLGEFRQARYHLEEGLKLSRTVGDRALECNQLVALSHLALWERDDAHALTQARAALEMAVAVHAAGVEALALSYLGRAELALGRHGAAAEAFERAESVARAIGNQIQHDATAGRARVALAMGDIAGGIAFVEALLAHLGSGGTLDATFGTRLILLTCHQALNRAGDSRATEVLTRAHDELQTKAAMIDDPALRQSFLSNVPENREILIAWAAKRVAPTKQGHGYRSAADSSC